MKTTKNLQKPANRASEEDFRDYLIAVSRLKENLPGIPLEEVARKLGIEEAL
jgi:hypothetical protein